MHDEVTAFMVVALAGIVSGTVIVFALFATIRAAINRGTGRRHDALMNELTAIRAELAELRKQQNDVMLSFDGSLDRVERRLLRLEGPRPSVPEAEHAAVRR